MIFLGRFITYDSPGDLTLLRTLYISLSEMKTSVLLGLFLLASLSLSRDVHLHLSLPGRDSLRSEGPSPDSIQKDPSYCQWTPAQRR